jgi:integrase
MALVNFYLKDPKSKAPTLIYLFFSFDRQRMKVSTRESIHPRYWNETNQCAKKTFENATAFNSYLDKMGEDYKKAYRLLKSVNERVTPESLKVKVAALNGESDPKTKNLVAFVDSFIAASGSKVTHGTLKNYKTTLSVLLRFKVHSNKRLDFDSINLDFYDDFVGYQEKVLGYSGNTIGKNIKNLKVFMSEATERGLNSNLEYLKKGFKVFKEDVDNIYLSDEELLELYQLDLSAKLHLEMVRDLFIVGCYTGLRFSDFSQIKPEHIKRGTFSIRTQKTDEPVVIPIHPLVQAIMKKYDVYPNSLPPSYAIQKMNKYLKVIGELMGLDEKVITKKTIGGQKVESKLKKFEMITTHTARRSFATNLFLQGFPTISIMKITGHRSDKTFMQYIKMTPEQNAEKLRKHWERIFNENNIPITSF